MRPTRRQAAFAFTADNARALTQAAVSSIANPAETARTLSGKKIGAALALFFAVILVAVALAPGLALPLLAFAAGGYFFASMLMKAFLILLRLATPSHAATAPDPLDDDDLPVVTILAPLFREAQTIPSLAASLNALDYPRDKLDIKLIFEAQDDATIAAAHNHIPDARIEFIIAPPSTPQTKPKACNVALFQARGEIIVIYDAEDIPAPDQLRKAAARFANADENLACLQAHLNWYNWRDGVLTRLFAIEYHLWFEFFLPGLQRIGAPIPLGGTSNFIRTDILRGVGGWDAYNVTEDADLGFRLARAGYRTEVLASLTLEEAPCRIGPWLRQRSRWIKGHMQTWLVHMRMMRETGTRAGLATFASAQLFLAGNALAALAMPVTLLALALTALRGAPFSMAGAFLLAAGYVTSAALSAIALLYIRRSALIPALLLTPFYWLAASIAAWRALAELVFDPFHWAKTEHVQCPEAVLRSQGSSA